MAGKLQAFLRVLGSGLSPQAFQANMALHSQERAEENLQAREQRVETKGIEDFNVQQVFKTLAPLGIAMKRAKEAGDTKAVNAIGAQVKQVAEQYPEFSDSIKNSFMAHSMAEPETKFSFGKGLTGQSQNILVSTQKKINNNVALTPTESLQRAFALSNVTAPRDSIQTDPVTGEKSIVTIRPELPSEFSPKASASKRIETTVIDEQKSSKKERIEAEGTLKAMKTARNKIKSLISTVTKDPGVTGTVGKARRVISGVAGQIGLPSESGASIFETQLETARSDLRSLIDEGRFSDEDRKRLNLLVKGTGFLDSPQNTIAAYGEILKLIDSKIGSAKETLGILPEGVTEEAIKFTMKKHKMTRKQVLEKLRGRK